MARAWIFQDSRQKQKLGEKKCPWSVGWLDPSGRRKSQRVGLKSAATQFARKLEGELAAGVFKTESTKGWPEFRTEYEAKIASKLRVSSQREIQFALNAFERICKPAKLAAIKTATIDEFIAKRRLEPGRKPGSTVSPYTIKKEVSNIRAALNVAIDWGYIAELPKFRKIKTPEPMPRPVSPDDFGKIYESCSVANMPADQPFPASDWWQAFVFFAATTGWRRAEILALRWEDVDLETGQVTTRAGDNKAGRTETDYLPEPTIEHLRKLVSFSPLVFSWPHDPRTLDVVFARIQDAAGIKLPCPHTQSHECTAACHRYGLHDLRRMYASENAERLPMPVLQKKMRHKSISTTMRYVSMASRMKQASQEVYVPCIRKSGG